MKIEIQGKTVEVDDSFANLPPEQQQATVDEIANSLSTKGKSAFEEATGVSESSPLFGGVTGAIVGIPAGHIIEKATKAAMTPSSEFSGTRSTGPGTGGEKWARNWAGMEKPGVSVPQAAAAYQRTKGHGPVTEKITERFGPGAKLDIGSYTEAQKARPYMERVRSVMPESVRRTGQAVSGAASALPTWLGRGMAGASAGFQGVDAYNRMQQGDILGGAIGGLGALGSAAALVPHPLVRGVGTALGAGAPVLNALIDEYRRKNAPPAQGYAGGGQTAKMLQQFYRGFAGVPGQERVFVSPQKGVADYYAAKRAEQTGLAPGVEAVLADPFAGRKFGHSLPMDKFNREAIVTQARELSPLDIQSTRILEKKKGGLSTPAWQRKEGQNPEGGLNAAGRASYKRETGGELKRPQPEGGARRDSFCKRMKGMKKKLTSAETANDPDSRINKSLRAWNC